MNVFRSSHLWSIGGMLVGLPATLAGLLWLGAIVIRADTHYVRPYNESQANPYTTWETAGTNIIDVVNTAMTNENVPRVVWVSNSVSGGYVLTNQIIITNALTLQSTNGPDVTIINGGYAPGNLITNRCLWMSNNASAFVSGFTFSNGAVLDQSGAGVRMDRGTLSNCIVRNNIGFSLASSIYGGGVYMSNATAIACRVTDNVLTNLATSSSLSENGAGIYTLYRSTIDKCLISNNVIYIPVTSDNKGWGAGVMANAGNVRSSMICNNRNIGGYSYCGGIYMAGVSAGKYGVIDSCTVTVNQAGYVSGGGIRLHYVDLTITNCIVSYNSPDGIRLNGVAGVEYRVFNTAVFGNTGTAVTVAGDRNWLTDCVITGNTGVGATVVPVVYAYLSNCVVRGNARGVSCYSGTMLRNCLIAGNSNLGGMFIPSSCQTASVCGCTIVGNWSTNSGSGIRIEATNANILSISSCVIYSNGASGTDDVYDACAPTNYDKLQYSCLGTNPGFTGAGIIVANPQFKDFAGGNYRLAANSPCINTGSNETWMTNSYDLDGNRRIRYGTVDMGVYELLRSGTIYGFH